MTTFISNKNIYSPNQNIMQGDTFTDEQASEWGIGQHSLDAFIKTGVIEVKKDEVKEVDPPVEPPVVDDIPKSEDKVDYKDMELPELNAIIADLSEKAGIEPCIFDDKDSALEYLTGE